jgi:hypothetical protein
MNTAKADFNEIESDTAEKQADMQGDKRFSDSVGPRGRPLKLDRRDCGRDHRISNTQDYLGTPRRVTIDRRDSSEERRDES